MFGHGLLVHSAQSHHTPDTPERGQWLLGVGDAHSSLGLRVHVAEA